MDMIFAVKPHRYGDRGFDPAQSPVAIALVSSFPPVHADSGIVAVPGFVPSVRAWPLFYTSASISSPGHLAMGRLRQRLGSAIGSPESAACWQVQ